MSKAVHIQRVVVIASLLGLVSCTAPENPAEREELRPIKHLVPDVILAGNELYRPVSVDLDDEGNLYVLDAGSNRIYVYDPAGVLRREIGRAGDGPGEFRNLGLGSRLVVAHQKALVLMPAAQRVQVFELPAGASSAAFHVAAWPTTIGFDGSEIHLTMNSITGRLPRAAVYRFSLDGALKGTYGEEPRPEWDGPLAASAFRAKTAGLLSVRSDGKVIHFFRWWPWARVFQDGELLWERWFDFKWLEDQAVAQLFDWPRDSIYLDEEALQSDPRFDVMVLFDLASSADQFFAFLNGSFLMVLDGPSEPRAMYFLGGPPREDIELRPGRPGYPAGGIQLGVSQDGSRVCVPIHREAVVYCYDIGEHAPPAG